MQDRREKMDWRNAEQTMEESKGGGALDKKHFLISKQAVNNNMAGKNPTNGVESSTALQRFLDRIPIGAIPGINNSSAAVMELKTGDCLGDAIRLLYEKNVFGAPIAVDALDTDTATIGRKLSDGYIGFIDFARIVLWFLEECERAGTQTKEESSNGIFSMLEHNPHIAHTKIGELAKSFLWDPFFPVHSDATLSHVLLLLSKHQVQFVPVTEQSSPKVIGYITQACAQACLRWVWTYPLPKPITAGGTIAHPLLNWIFFGTTEAVIWVVQGFNRNAVIQLLLQSSGLEWFDNIADKALSEFRFENDKCAVFVYGDQSIAEAMHILWQSQMGAVAVVERETKRLIGCVRSIDLHLLLDNIDLFNNRKSLTAEEFIHMDRSEVDSEPTIERDLGAFLSAGALTLKNTFLPRMDSPVTNKKTDTLKQAMNKLAAAKGNFCFLIDGLQRVQGVVTLRDMIRQFAPPSMDSTINGGGFFNSALEQTGCHIEKGTMICDH